MRKTLLLVLLVLVLTLAGCEGTGASAANGNEQTTTTLAPVPTTQSKPSWVTSCTVKTELVDVPGAGFAVPNLFATVKIANSGKGIQDFHGYRIYFWSGGIIVGWWATTPRTTYASIREIWTYSDHIPAGSNSAPSFEPGKNIGNVEGDTVPDFIQTGKPITCTIGAVY